MGGEAGAGAESPAEPSAGSGAGEGACEGGEVWGCGDVLRFHAGGAFGADTDGVCAGGGVPVCGGGFFCDWGAGAGVACGGAVAAGCVFFPREDLWGFGGRYVPCAGGGSDEGFPSAAEGEDRGAWPGVRRGCGGADFYGGFGYGAFGGGAAVPGGGMAQGEPAYHAVLVGCG